MKKTIILVLLFLSVSPCFADGQSVRFEVGLGYQGLFFNGTLTFNQPEPGSSDIIEDIKTTLHSFAINFAFIPYLTESFGFGFYGNILFTSPEEAVISVLPISGFDCLIGPTFMLYNSEAKYVSFTPGMHLAAFFFNDMGLSDETKKDMSSYQIGLGANVTGEYYFTPKVYGYARFQLSYDLYSQFSRGGKYSPNNPISGSGGGSGAQDGKGSISAWNINPSIGLGYKL